MKRSILPIFLALMLTTQHAEAQRIEMSSLSAAGMAKSSVGTDFVPARNTDRGVIESRSYSMPTSSGKYAESPVSRATPSYSASVDRSWSGGKDRGDYSPTFRSSHMDKNNLVSSTANSYYSNTKKEGFAVSSMSAPASTGYTGYTGVTSSVKTDTLGHCQAWSPLMVWLAYRYNQRHGINYALPPEFALSMFNPSPSFIASVEDYIVMDEKSPDMYTFFDGYIVYCHDTAYGLLNLTADGVYFDGGDLQLKIPYKHRGLKAVVLYNNRNEELYLKRVGNDKILSRVLHDGKLLIYDCYYSFDKSNFSYASLNAAYRNKEQRPLVVLDQRLNMIRTINRVYGSDLPSNYAWHAVVQHINTLD